MSDGLQLGTLLDPADKSDKVKINFNFGASLEHLGPLETYWGSWEATQII